MQAWQVDQTTDAASLAADALLFCSMQYSRKTAKQVCVMVMNLQPTRVTKIVPSAPFCLWNANISFKGKSQMTSLQSDNQTVYGVEWAS